MAENNSSIDLRSLLGNLITTFYDLLEGSLIFLVVVCAVFECDFVEIWVIDVLHMSVPAQSDPNGGRDAKLEGKRHTPHINKLSGTPIVNPAKEGIVDDKSRCSRKTHHDLTMTDVSLHHDALLIIRLCPSFIFAEVGPPEELAHE